jgi:dihydrolipoamide dehydrogenase
MEKDSLPMSMDYDVLIIGGGAAGKDAAFLAARAGLKTLLIEKEKLGGTSYHKGCYMIRALQMCAQSFRTSGFLEKNPANLGIGYGYITQGWSEWSKVRLDVTGRLAKELEEELAKSEIPVKMGSAKFLDNHTVQISSSGGASEKVTAENIIIATGSEPSYPGDGTTFPFLKERKGLKVLNSAQILENSAPPTHLVVLGAGHIGCELASIYRTLGSRVTVVEEKSTVLWNWDPLVGQKVSESLTEAGVTIKTGNAFEAQMLPADCDMVLVATGRLGNTKDLNLSQIGVEGMQGQFILTTPELRIRGSEFSNIYVIGDANGLLLYDSAAYAQARVAVENIAGNPTPLRLWLVPRSINTSPPAAFVGWTEPEVKAYGVSYEVFGEDLASTRSGIERERNVIKLLYDHGSRRFLSCLAIGPDSNEIVNQASFCLSTNTSIEAFLNVSTIHPSPTEYMVRALRRRFDHNFQRGPRGMSLGGND